MSRLGFLALLLPIFQPDASSLFLLLPVDRWIIVSWLVQHSSWHPCSGSPCACRAAHQPGTAAGSRVLQNQCLKSEIQELVLKKLAVVSAPLASKPKAAFRVIAAQGLKSRDRGQRHILVACGHHLVLRAVLWRGRHFPWPVLGQECSLAEGT